jgi:hypothetical protein
MVVRGSLQDSCSGARDPRRFFDAELDGVIGGAVPQAAKHTRCGGVLREALSNGPAG